MHFAILVIGENVEEQLKPFQELDLDNVADEYLEFCNMEKDEDTIIEYKEGTFDVFVPRINDNTTTGLNMAGIGEKDTLFSWDFKVTKLSDEARNKLLHKKTIPRKEMYTDFKSYLRLFHEYEYCEGEKAYGYMHNPNGKWDWWLVGGRWTGILKLKEGCTDFGIGEPGLMTDPSKEGFCDSAKKKNIDLDNMKDFRLFGVLRDGKWEDKDDHDGDNVKWNKRFDAILGEVGDDETISVVDIHI